MFIYASAPPVVGSTCPSYFKSFRSPLSLRLSPTASRSLTASVLTLSILVTPFILLHLLILTTRSRLSSIPHTSSFHFLRHRWYHHFFIHLLFHTQTYTYDRLHLLHYTKCFQSLTHSHFHILLLTHWSTYWEPWNSSQLPWSHRLISHAPVKF